MGTWLGLDVGERRIGVAVSDPGGVFAQPLTTLDLGREGREAVLERLGELARARDVGGVVVGLPRHMSGDEGVGAEAARRFAELLERRLGLPVEMWDERLSSVEAERRLVEAGVRRRKRREVVDRVAAAIVLQAFLDRRGADRRAGSRDRPSS